MKMCAFQFTNEAPTTLLIAVNNVFVNVQFVICSMHDHQLIRLVYLRRKSINNNLKEATVSVIDNFNRSEINNAVINLKTTSYREIR